MGLRFQKVPIKFVGGVETKMDSKSIPPTKLQTLENGVFTAPGRIKKRNGHTSFAPGIFTASKVIGSAAALFSRGAELFMVAQQNRSAGTAVDEVDGWMLYSLDDKVDKLQEIGHFIPVELSKTFISRPGSQTLQLDWAMPNIAQANGYTGYFYVSRTGLRKPFCSIIEDSTGATIVDEHELSALIHYNPQTIGVGTKIHAWAQQNGNTISFWNIDATGFPTVPALDGTKIADSSANRLFDVCYSSDSGGSSVVAYQQNGTLRVIVKWFDAAGALQHTVDLGAASVCKNVVSCQRVYDHNTSAYYIAICYQDNATGNIECSLRNEDSTLYKTIFVITTATAAEAPRNLTVVEDPSYDAATPANSSMRFYIEIPGTAGWENFVRTATGKFDSTGVSDGVTFRGCGLASKGFIHDGKARVWVVNDSDTQSTLFLKSAISATKHRTDAKFLLSRADGVSDAEGLPNVVIPSADNYKMAALYRSRLSSGGEERTGIVDVSMNFDLLGLSDVEVEPTNLLATGGLLHDVDGRSAELGFHLYPENISLGALAGASVPDDPFYVAIYEWIDREGQRHRSAPTPSPETINHGAPTNNVVTVQCLHQGEYDRLAKVEIIVYRLATDGNYHYVAKRLNDPTADSVAINDTATDAVAITGEVLYCNVGSVQNAGALENIGPPACRIICVGKDRVFLVPDEDRTSIWPSKKKVFGNGVAFSDFLNKRTTDGGDIEAMIEMDDKIIVFKENEIRVFSGDGPNQNGVGGAFTNTRLVTADVGCTNYRSVLRTDLGIMFDSNKGRYLLTRSLAVQYIGAPVEEWNSYAVIDARLIEDKNQARFILSNGVCLVYDYYMKQWSTFTNHVAVDADNYNGTYTFLKTDGTLRKESTAYLDVATAITMKLKTAWIKLQGLLGYQRVKWLGLVGEYESAHQLTVKMYYDYSDSFNVQTVNITAAAPEHYRIKPAHQKCIAFAVEIYDSGTHTGESFSLSALEPEIGFRRGTPPLRASKTV